MTPQRRTPTPTPRRIVGIGAAVAAMVAFVLLVANVFQGDETPDHPPPLQTTDRTPPIESENGPFRLRQDELGVALTATRDSVAHARTLSFYRSLRAYPGAPPRIPHGLTDEEFRSGSCQTCHRRGGYVTRFGNYAPVTPHPERTPCLQCHVPRDTLVGTPLPDRPGQDTCGQCHVDPDAPPQTLAQSTWSTVPWPELGRRAMPEAPLWIPHGLESRSVCLACHAGPGAVEEIRTDHPERIVCRQCHVPISDEGWTFPDPLGPAGPPLDGTAAAEVGS